MITITLCVFALIFTILTLVLIKNDKVNFINGIVLVVAIILLYLAMYTKINGLDIKFAIMFLITEISKYITYFVAGLFIYNGIYNSFVPKRTRKNSITDWLSLLLGVTLILVTILINKREEKIFLLVNLFMFYINIMFISFCLNCLIYKIATKREKYDIIIILGAGLADGIRPSRTLKARLDKAIQVYRKNTKAYIIVSGGKGENEKVSEAEAMKRYLTENEIPEDRIIKEDKSTNTYENLKYSKEKLEELAIENPKTALVTSSFHIYRAAIYAKLAKIEVVGVGSKTLWHFLPNSYIREFAAIIVRYKLGFLIYSILAIAAFFCIIKF